MDSFQNRDFTIPDGYAEEDIDGKLCLEDLDEDSELWLIRVPSDIHLSVLDKKKIYLGSNSNEINVKNIKTENGKLLECCAENCDIPSMCVVLPDKSGKKLQAVRKAFKGAILISEGLNLHDDTEVKSENEDDPPATTIEDTPNLSLESKKNKKKKRSYSHNTDNHDLNNETEDVDNVNQRVGKHKHLKKHRDRNINYENEEVKSEPEDDPPATTIDDIPNLSLESRKKHKKKKRSYSHNTDNSDLNYETEDADNVSQRVAKHKHLKKHPDRNINYENEEVKSEPEDEPPATTIDDIPNISLESRKKNKKKKKSYSHNADNNDLNYETGDADNVSQHVAKHKHLKKRPDRNINYENEEVKSEPEDDPPATTIDDNPNLSLESRKKNKKKKRSYSHNTDNNDLHYETEDADNVSQHVSKHKHLKKRPDRNLNYENEEIKSEPESTDVDGFPTCRSQTKVK